MTLGLEKAIAPLPFYRWPASTRPVKGYRYALGSMALVSVVNGMLYPVLALYVYGISEDLFLVGLTMALPFLAAVPMAYAWGLVSDRLGSRRLVMAACGCVGGLLFFALPGLDAWWLVAVRLVQISFTTSFVLLNAVATECYPERKGSSVGDLNLVGGIGSALGALAAGFLLPSDQLVVGSGAVTLVFAIAGLSTIAASLVLLPMDEKRRAAKTATEAAGEDVTKAVAKASTPSFGNRRGIAVVALASLLMPMSGYIVFSIFPVYLSGLDIPWDSTMVAGVFTALSAVTGIFASGLAGRACDRWGRKWVLVSAGAAYFIVWLGMGLTRDPLVTAFFWAVPVWSFFFVSATAMVSDLTTEEERGRGIGLVNSAINLGGAIGAIAAGYLLSRGIVDNVFPLAAAVALAGMAVALVARETLARRGDR
jgi:MFS family permease